MIDRWMPVVAAALGLLGGMGGAYIGGSVANQGQEQRFREERATRIEDSRRDTYVAYLRELENHFFLGGTPEKARAAQAAVLLVSSASVRDAASAAVAAANGSNLKRYTKARDVFIDRAQAELAAGS